MRAKQDNNKLQRRHDQGAIHQLTLRFIRWSPPGRSRTWRDLLTGRWLGDVEQKPLAD